MSSAPAAVPRSYPQAWRTERHRWWRPLLAVAVMLAGGVSFLVWSVVTQLGAAFAYAPATFFTEPEAALLDTSWTITPLGMLSTNLALAIPIPIAMIAALVVTGWPGTVSSVVGRLRWGLLAGSCLVTVLVLVPLGFVAEAVAPSVGEAVEIDPAAGWQVLLVVILLTTPLQAAGEEYFFRGWLTQVIGAWCRPAWLAVALPLLASATLFAFAHGLQNSWLFADRFFFGIVAGLLVWRTGGLECAIALHVVNNLFAFAVAIATGTMEQSLLVTEVEPLSGVLSMSGTAVCGLALWGFARWRRVRRLRGTT